MPTILPCVHCGHELAYEPHTARLPLEAQPKLCRRCAAAGRPGVLCRWCGGEATTDVLDGPICDDCLAELPCFACGKDRPCGCRRNYREGRIHP